MTSLQSSSQPKRAGYAIDAGWIQTSTLLSGSGNGNIPAPNWSRYNQGWLDMALDIIEIGHPVLREVATGVSAEELQSPEMQQFIDDLIATKREANGAGIAANQVASTRRISWSR